MKIVSWNVNSVRARIDNILEYIKESDPDVIFLQEIKTQEETFPKELFLKNGYHSYIFGQKSYNGVAFVSKKKLLNIKKNFINDKFKQSRVITGEMMINKLKIKLINIYVPNGNPVDTEKYEYKKYWFDKFIKKTKKEFHLNPNIIIAGDFNVIPEKIDVYDSTRYENDALFRLEIRKKYRELINVGFCDAYRHVNRSKQEFTYWDYFASSWKKNYGMRIDHFLVSNNLLNNISNININKKPRSKIKPSDHTPVELKII